MSTWAALWRWAADDANRKAESKNRTGENPKPHKESTATGEKPNGEKETAP